MRIGRAWIFVGAAGLALALLGQADFLSPVAAAGVTVASSIALALLAHGGVPLATEAVAFGASGALAYEATHPYLPLVASGLLLTFVFGSRAMRSRTWRELGFHLGVAFVSGVSASWVAHVNEGLETTLWMTAIAVAALLSSLPWIVPTDAPRTFALRRAAARARGPQRVRLLRAVIAHRRLRDLDLPSKLRRRVERSFDEVIRRAEQRIGREASGDVKLSIDQLVRVARAARAREDLLAGMSPDALEQDSDHLEAEVEALAELRA